MTSRGQAKGSMLRLVLGFYMLCSLVVASGAQESRGAIKTRWRLSFLPVQMEGVDQITTASERGTQQVNRAVFRFLLPCGARPVGLAVRTLRAQSDKSYSSKARSKVLVQVAAAVLQEHKACSALAEWRREVWPIRASVLDAFLAADRRVELNQDLRMKQDDSKPSSHSEFILQSLSPSQAESWKELRWLPARGVSIQKARASSHQLQNPGPLDTRVSAQFHSHCLDLQPHAAQWLLLSRPPRKALHEDARLWQVAGLATAKHLQNTLSKQRSRCLPKPLQLDLPAKLLASGTQLEVNSSQEIARRLAGASGSAARYGDYRLRLRPMLSARPAASKVGGLVRFTYRRYCTDAPIGLVMADDRVRGNKRVAVLVAEFPEAVCMGRRDQGSKPSVSDRIVARQTGFSQIESSWIDSWQVRFDHRALQQPAGSKLGSTGELGQAAQAPAHFTPLKIDTPWRLSGLRQVRWAKASPRSLETTSVLQSCHEVPAAWLIAPSRTRKGEQLLAALVVRPTLPAKSQRLRGGCSTTWHTPWPLWVGPQSVVRPLRLSF